MNEADVQKVIEHLAYLGYDTAPPKAADGWYAAHHAVHLDFYFRPFPSRVRVFCPYYLGVESLGDQMSEFLEFVNLANENSQLAGIHLHRDDDGEYGVYLRAALPADYDRSVWAALLDSLRHDMDYIHTNMPRLKEPEVSDAVDGGQASAEAGSASEEHATVTPGK
jgi:hypothetical protein